MDQELFNPQSSSVSSSRIIYTPSTFARTSLLHLQEVGSLQAVHPHVSKRSNLVSFLCFIVLSGEGELRYEGEEFKLKGQVWMFSTTCPFVRGMYQKPVSRNTINSLAESSSRSCVIRTITEPSSATFISSIQGYLVPNIS